MLQVNVITTAYFHTYYSTRLDSPGTRWVVDARAYHADAHKHAVPHSKKSTKKHTNTIPYILRRHANNVQLIYIVL